MKINKLTAIALAAFSVAACGAKTDAPQAPEANAAPASSPLYDVRCTDAAGNLVAEGQSRNGPRAYYTYSKIDMTDGRRLEMHGGTCTAILPAEPGYVAPSGPASSFGQVTCRDMAGVITAEGQTRDGLRAHYTYSAVNLVDGRRVEQHGGSCAVVRPAR